MPIPTNDIHRQVLLEIALSISGELELQALLGNCLPLFLRKLNCTLAGVIQTTAGGWETSLVLPRTMRQSDLWLQQADCLHRQIQAQKGSPLLEVAEKYYYGFELRGFGLLILGRAQALDHLFLKEFMPLTGMLARACEACLEVQRRRAMEASLQQKQAELARQKQILDTIIDHAPLSIWLRNAQGSLLLANRLFLEQTGLGTQNQSLTPEEIVLCAQTDRIALTSDGPRHFEEAITMLDGRQHQLQTIKTRLHTPEGELLGVLGLGLDVTHSRQVEASLRSSEERYRGIVESQTDLVVRADVQGRFTFVNDAYCHAFGKSREDLLGSNFMPLVHADDQASTQAAMQALYRPPFRAYIEQRARTVQGWRWLAWEDYAIRNDAGEVVEIQGVGRDITALKDAEQMVRSLSERLRLALDAAAIGVWDYDVVADTIVWDARMFVLYGLASQSTPVTYAQWLNCIHPHDRLRCEEEVQLALNGHKNLDTTFQVIRPDGRPCILRGQARVLRNGQGEAVRMIGINLDLTQQKQTEERLRMQAALETLMARLSTRFINLQLEEIDRNIQASLEEIGTLLGMDRIYVFQFKANRTLMENSFEWCNKGIKSQREPLQDIPVDAFNWWMTQLNRFEAIAISDVAALPPAAAAEKALLTQQGIQSALVAPLVWNRRLEGFLGVDLVHQSRNWSDTDAAPLKMLASILINAIKRRETAEQLIQSQTELQELNATLELKVEERSRQLSVVQQRLILGEKMASIGQLAAGIAHELNNPVGFVAMNFDILEENMHIITAAMGHYKQALNVPAGSEQQAQLLEEAGAYEKQAELDFILEDIDTLFSQSRDGFRRISTIITSMRDFSHSDPREEFVATDLNKSLRDTLTLAHNTYKNHAEVHTELEDVPRVKCIPGQINQVFLNIIVNAAQAIANAELPSKGLITIRTRADQTNFYCDINNNGPVIPESIRNRLFDAFFTTKPPGQGTGLGLSISYDIIVRKHKGQLSVSSDAQAGTTFHISLPIRV